MRITTSLKVKSHLFPIAFLLILVSRLSVMGQDQRVVDPRRLEENSRLESKYDKTKDITVVRVGPMVLMGRLYRLPEYRLTAFFAYSGKQKSKPSVVTFALDAVHSAKDMNNSLQDQELSILIDGKGSKLGVLSVLDSKKGPKIAVEWLAVSVSAEIFFQVIADISAAKSVDISIGGIRLPLVREQIEMLEVLAKRAKD